MLTTKYTKPELMANEIGVIIKFADDYPNQNVYHFAMGTDSQAAALQKLNEVLTPFQKECIKIISFTVCSDPDEAIAWGIRAFDVEEMRNHEKFKTEEYLK